MRVPPIVLVLLLSLLTAPGGAQRGARQQPISLPLQEQTHISLADTQVIAVQRAAVARAAAFYGYDLDSSWKYEQAVCPLAPGHVLLRFSKVGASGVSSFTAAVPRERGLVRIVPLVHDGTASFQTAWGQHSYDVFNAITAANGGLRQKSVDIDSGDAFLWGLCYVAIAGETGLVDQPDREMHVYDATEPTLRIGAAGEISLAFTVRDDSADYSVWRLAFSARGTLVHAGREQHALRELGVEPVPAPASSPGETAIASRPENASPGAPHSAANNSPPVEHPIPDSGEPVGRPVPQQR